MRIFFLQAEVLRAEAERDLVKFFNGRRVAAFFLSRRLHLAPGGRKQRVIGEVEL